MELLTTKELAATLKVTEVCIYRWLQQGLTHVSLGRSKRFVLEDVLEWLKSDKKPKGK